MKDIAFVFSICLILILGITSLDRAVDKISAEASHQAGQGLAGFFRSYEAALMAAREEGLPVVLVIGRTGEEQTERFKDEVLRSSQVQAVMERFAWAFIDAGQDLQRTTLERFGAKQTTLLTCMVDETGRELRRMEGFLPTHAFLAELARGLKKIQEQPVEAMGTAVTFSE